MDTEYELVLLVKNEVFVFRIPPLSTASRGHRAADWNLQTPDWVGRLRLVSISNRLEIRLEDKTTGNLYAKAPISEIGGVEFEQVTDSSRYFVIRLKNDNGQTAFVGIGFADRGDSFDLNVSVQDHFKSLKKSEEITKAENDVTPSLDLGFKEGQTITVNIGKKSTASSSSGQQPKPKSDNNGIVPFLPPPPSSSGRIRKSQPN
ncbi:adaptin ear-binding coat-associated protein 1 [Ditylenchus destructor]|uniref:Adaptin ear-binding coat-associated protein 1 n=1 Tax=Ditylenchus destructor TaxID=166010 RepID=A0AAD4NHB8_9BILA|nr:adaptin ear-binding coat-associated protein 1 [Ditylenchus destructor]